jgi:hypothetical protein
MILGFIVGASNQWNETLENYSKDVVQLQCNTFKKSLLIYLILTYSFHGAGYSLKS